MSKSKLNYQKIAESLGYVSERQLYYFEYVKKEGASTVAVRMPNILTMFRGLPG